MRRIKLFLFLAVTASAIAQVQTTSIVGPIRDAFGNLYSGSFTVQSQQKTNTGWAIVSTVRTVFVTGGVIGSLNLVPDDSSVPNLTSHLITFANGDKWVCVVPTSSAPVPFTSACKPGTQGPNVGSSFSISQVIPSSQDGDVITTQNGIAVWATSLGLNYYSTAVTASTSIVVNPLTHRLPGNNFVVVCDGLAECGSVNVATDGTVTVRNNPAWSGTLYIVTTKASYSLPFASALNASSLWPVHHLQSVSAVACYDSAGNQFETGDTAITEHNLGISGLFANSLDITVSLSASVPQTGRCVVLGS